MAIAFHIGPFSLLDSLALLLVLALWLVIGWFVENPPATRPSVSRLMERYRREWMVQFVTREPRIFDAAIVDNLRQGTAFFSSATLIAIGGGVALAGNPAMLAKLAMDLSLLPDASGMQLRALLVVGFLANALLKFIWSNRLFGYCAILMAAAPNDPADPLALHRARQAGEVNISAAKGFNRGMRSIYFALGSLAWMLGPWPLMASALLTAGVLIRREFGSHSRMVMQDKV